MEDLRSKSYGDGRMQMERYGGALPGASGNLQDLRCYSASYGSHHTQLPKEMKLKKGKSSGSLKGWSFNDPELQRKKRVASYKVYAMEGRMKGSVRRSFRWLKDKYTQVVYGWW